MTRIERQAARARVRAEEAARWDRLERELGRCVRIARLKLEQMPDTEIAKRLGVTEAELAELLELMDALSRRGIRMAGQFF